MRCKIMNNFPFLQLFPFLFSRIVSSGSRRDRYLGMTAAIPQVPVPTATHGRAALVVDPAVGGFDVIALDAEGGNHGSVLVIISQFLNNSKRNARQPGQLSDSCPKILNPSYS